MRLLLIVSGIVALAAAPALAQDSVGHASAALDASGNAVGHLAESGVQTVAGVSVLPLAVAGGASAVGGLAVMAAGASVALPGVQAMAGATKLMDETWGRPLKVDPRVVVQADPAPRVPYTPQKPAR